MKEPFLNRHEPQKREYEQRTEDITIYSYWQHIEYDMDYDDDDDDENEDDEERDYWKYSIRKKDHPETPKIDLEDMNLQKLIDMIPAGVTPADIKMEIYENMGAMGPSSDDGITIKFFYTKTLPADMEQYKKDKAAYDVEYAEYKKKKQAYDKWVKDQELKKLEAQIKALKKGKTLP